MGLAATQSHCDMAVSAHLVNYTHEYFSMMLKTLWNFAYVVLRIQSTDGMKKQAQKKGVNPKLVYGDD